MAETHKMKSRAFKPLRRWVPEPGGVRGHVREIPMGGLKVCANCGMSEGFIKHTGWTKCDKEPSDV